MRPLTKGVTNWDYQLALYAKVEMIGKGQVVYVGGKTYQSTQEGDGDRFDCDARVAARLVDEGVVKIIKGAK